MGMFGDTIGLIIFFLILIYAPEIIILGKGL